MTSDTPRFDIPSRRHEGVSSYNFARAIGIMLVIANHAEFGHWGGGVNILILISGLAFARFAFGRSTEDTLHAMRGFSVRLAIPTLALTVYYAIHRKAFDWAEFAFVSNWAGLGRVSSFPIWYPHAMTQILLFLAVVFWLFDLTRRIQRAPVRATLIILIAALTANLLPRHIWPAPEMGDALPHLLLWNFVLGWTLWAILQVDAPLTDRRLWCTGVLVLAVATGLYASGGPSFEQRSITLLAGGFIVIWRDRIPMPFALARFLDLAAQASFSLFLLHFLIFDYVNAGLKLLHLGFMKQPPIIWAATIVIGMMLWVVFTAAIRAYRSMRRESLAR